MVFWPLWPKQAIPQFSIEDLLKIRYNWGETKEREKQRWMIVRPKYKWGGRKVLSVFSAAWQVIHNTWAEIFATLRLNLWWECDRYKDIAQYWTRPSVNYAKDWLDHSFLSLVLSSLEKSFTLDVITRGQSTSIFLCIGPFSAWWRTNERTTRWS